MHDQIYDNICQVIGNTPVVRLNRIPKEGWAEMLVKLESFNPGGSVKDRIGLSMIEAAERDRKAETGRNHRRADERKYGNRPGDGRGGQRI